MRQIQLTDCEIVILSLPRDVARRAAVSATCERLGLPYQIIDAIECTPGAVGCGLSHIKALRAWNGERPLLILEDDVAATDDFSPALDVPDDTDALYCGASIYGAVEPVDFIGFTNAVAAEQIAAGLVKIHNMLSSHAIMHLTERWRSAAIEAMTAAIVDQGRPPDCGLAMIQGEYNVLALQQPAFYQSAALQPSGRAAQQDSTMINLPASEVGTVVDFEIDGVGTAFRLVRIGSRLTWEMA